MTELPKEWHELAQRESVILNPSNCSNQEIYRLAHTDGATAHKQAVERLLKSKMKLIEDMAARIEISPSFLVNYDLYLELLTELQTLTPTSND
jgi:hypothetical protein